MEIYDLVRGRLVEEIQDIYILELVVQLKVEEAQFTSLLVLGPAEKEAVFILMLGKAERKQEEIWPWRVEGVPQRLVEKSESVQATQVYQE